MGPSAAGLCHSLLLLLLSLSFTLLEGAATIGHRNRPRQYTPLSSNAAGVPLAAASRVFWISPWHPRLAASGAPVPSDPAPLQTPAREPHALVEKGFSYDDVSLGQVISAETGEETSSASASQGSEREADDTENSIDTDGDDDEDGDDDGEVDAEHVVEEVGLQAAARDQDVSRLGVFHSPRPELSDPALYDRPACRTEDDLQGVCHANQLSCRLRGGAFSHKCTGDNGICCIFQHSCSAFTRERISYYRNPDFPYSSTGNLICNYKVLIQPKVCAIRIDVLNYTSPITKACTEIQLSFLVGNHTRALPVCGVLTGTTVVFDGLDATRDREVVISHVLGGKEPYRFNLRATQILCSSIKPLPIESACGRRNVGSVRHRRSPELPLDNSDSQINHDLEDPPVEVEFEATGDQLATRIVGGQVATVNEWPWQVGLLKRAVAARGASAQFFCGATLINKEYIVTAAHCVNGFKAFNHTDMRKHIIALIGDHDLRSLNESQQVFRGIKKIIIHPLYDPSRNKNDIALMQLSSPVNYTGAIAPACLPTHPRDFTDDDDINVSGWGVVSFNGSRRGPSSPVLRTATVKAMDRQECDKKWEAFDSKSTVYRDLPHLNEKQGCIGNSPGAACFGDSGGPVTFREKNGRFTVIGAVSFGPPICKVGGEFPTIYTRVSTFVSWITAAMLDIF